MKIISLILLISFLLNCKYYKQNSNTHPSTLDDLLLASKSSSSESSPFESSPSLAQKKSYQNQNLCYFSLNSSKEFAVMKEFINSINQSQSSEFMSNKNIQVTEWQIDQTDPQKSFKKLIDSGIHCDGLILSGHHTGAFGGARATGSLTIDFIEELSCKPEYENFFQKVKSLWLQGCRTLGAKIDSDGNNIEFHVERVGRVLNEDNLDQNFTELGVEFSATFDQSNPLYLRYSRMLPNARIFGWTKVAPGERAKSEWSIPYHIYQLGRLLNYQSLPNPRENQINHKSYLNFGEILHSLLKEGECENCEQAWTLHGHGGKGAFYNTNLGSIGPLNWRSDDSFDVLKEVTELNCLLKNKKQKNEKIKQAVLDISSNSKLVGYTFNSIFTLIKTGSRSQKNMIKQILKKSSVIKQSLYNSMHEKNLGLLTRMKRYSVYRDLWGSDLILEKKFARALTKVIINPFEELDVFLVRHYKQQVIDGMIENQAIDIHKMTNSILEDSDFDQFDQVTLLAISYILTKLKTGDKEIYERIIENENLTDYKILYSVRGHVKKSGLSFLDKLYLKKLIKDRAASYLE